MIGSGLHSPRSVSSTFCCLGREWLALMEHVEEGCIKPRDGGAAGEKGPVPPVAPQSSCSDHFLLPKREADRKASHLRC